MHLIQTAVHVRIPGGGSVSLGSLGIGGEVPNIGGGYQGLTNAQRISMGLAPTWQNGGLSFNGK